MKAIYIIVICIALFLILFSLYGWIWHEDFEDMPISPELQTKYDKFKEFYDKFMINWTKAVATSLTTRQPAPDAAPEDPSEATKQTPTSPTNQELNAHVSELSNELKQQLPLITGPLPAKITKADLSALAKAKVDPKRFHVALKWMNDNMDASHKALDQALKGTTDGFEDMCQQIIQCNEEQKRKEEAQQQLTEEQIGKLFDSIIENKEIVIASKRNEELTAKSKMIQDQAQSGALLNKFQAPEEDEPKMKAPAGSNLWLKMKKEDPKKAKEIQQSMKAQVGAKEWADSINANLR